MGARPRSCCQRMRPFSGLSDQAWLSRLTTLANPEACAHALRCASGDINGLHQLFYHAGHLAGGTYFYTLETPEKQITRAMVLGK